MMLSYLFTVVLSAFLLFVVQPLIGKVVLPWFGGSAAVWSTVLFFFQFILLLGYTYSFLLTTYIDRRKQIYIHAGVLGLSLIVLILGIMGDGLPLLPAKPFTSLRGISPIIRIIMILGSSVGLPYFVLSTTGPLLQSWYLKDMPERTPYVLYALSNAGSFVALIAYPFSIEPLLSLTTQAWLWCGVYVVFVLSVSYIIVRSVQRKSLVAESPDVKPVVRKKTKGSQRQPRKRRPTSSGTIWKYNELSAEEREYVHRLSHAAQWLLLSMCTSILLAAVTNQITQDVAPIPLLWILPLALYLLSFVASFSIKATYLRITGPLFGIATLVTIFGLSQGNILSVPIQIGIYTITFFMASLACHGELTRLKPNPNLLTAYYLIIAMGGVLGTVVVSVVAPLIFVSYWEFHLGFVLCWAVLIVVLYLDRNSFLHKKWGTIALYALLIAPVTLVLYTGQYISTFQRTTVTSSRNFYGSLRLQELPQVADWPSFYVLSHGTTIHGIQYKASNLRKEPMAYYGVNSGVGRLLTGVNNSDAQGKRVGILGLGVGTLAAYGREQDVYRFYEINPDIVDLAEGREGYLTYLASSSADIEIILGDARLSLETELKSGNGQAYDVLVLDVFSGDAIPVHLLTEECFNLYLDHLAVDGVIAAHISTSHINLTPLLARVADKLDLHTILIEDDASGYPCCQSRWTLMSRNTDLLTLPIIYDVSSPLDKPSKKIRLWTDDYSNPLQVLY